MFTSYLKTEKPRAESAVPFPSLRYALPTICNVKPSFVFLRYIEAPEVCR